LWGRGRAAVVGYGGSMTVDDFLVWLGKTERELPMNTLRAKIGAFAVSALLQRAMSGASSVCAATNPAPTST